MALRGLKWIGIALAGAIVFALIASLSLTLILRNSVPQLSGTIIVDGVGAPVRIARDQHGIPNIQAQSLNDALFGLGFVHAQDRLWQLELTRRIVSGRVAEIAGPPAVAVDVYLRSLGLYRAAISATENLSPETNKRLQAYSNGINAAMRSHKGPLPPEFTIAQVTPAQWTPVDSVATVKSLALQLSANAFREALRVRLLENLTPQQLDQFHPPFPANVADAWSNAKNAGVNTNAFDRLGLLQDTLDLRGASNNWVVSGARSASGKPLLANDPHLGLSIPAIWYLARLSWPGGEAVGGTVPGVPGIVTGRTGSLAFGLTTTGADTQDLYVEKLNPKNQNEYLTLAGPKPFRSRTETIKVRFGSDRNITIRETDYGPVIPAEDPRISSFIPTGTVVALRWPALDAHDNTIETSLRILEIPDASEQSIASTFEPYKAPIQSWVYAGADGNFGKIVPGVIPIRDPNQTSLGIVPSAGWEHGAKWLRTTSYGEWPHYRNSSDGWYATANNKVVPDTHPHKVANEWDSEFRFRRIEQRLAERKIHSVDSFKSIQSDNVDQFALDVLPLLIARTKTGTKSSKDALKLLKSWDGAMSMDRAEPMIFAAWMRSWIKAVMVDEAGDAFTFVWNFWPDFTLRILNNQDGAERWCDNISTNNTVEDCGKILGDSLATALAELTDIHGSDMENWRWGATHIARMSHFGFGQIPGLNWLFNTSVPVPGGAHTIDRADHRLASTTPYAAVHGSGFRGITDMGAPEDSVYIISTGQSGNVFSPHYLDLVEIWAKGGYVKIPKTPAAGTERTMKILTLAPTVQPSPTASSR